MDFTIKTYKFEKPFPDVSTGEPLRDHLMGTNWPVVYLIHGNRQIYVGETYSVAKRMEQHLSPGRYLHKRRRLDTVEVVFDRTFNKSAILDVENSLINLFRFEIEQTTDPAKKSKSFSVLQNGNGGQSKLHNYYNRAHYQDEVEGIWNELKNRGMATNDYQSIVNDTIFKFSPYTSLNEEQKRTCHDILNGMMDALEGKQEGYTAIVKGLAGTGKTIVLINLLARVVQAMNANVTNIDDDSEDYDDALESSAVSLDSLSEEARLTNRIHDYVEKHGKLRIGYVAQMTSLRKTVSNVICELDDVNKQDAMGPFGVVKRSVSVDGSGQTVIEPFDILLVDEAHRLWQYRKIMPKKQFAENCSLLYSSSADPRDYTTLDWILSCSRTRVLVYDEFQSVKESDITPAQYRKALDRNGGGEVVFELKQQMRCRAGMDYLMFLKKVFDNNPDPGKASFEGYDLYFYDDANRLIDDIVTKNGQVGLSKVMTGYGWQWKKPRYDACEKKYKAWISTSGTKDTRARRVQFYLDNLSVEDGLIDFGGKHYVRNLDFDWLLEGDPREVGCIHTAQGYDLNYAGVLFGPEIDYSPEKGIFIKVEEINDTNSIGTSFIGLTGEERKERMKALTSYVVSAYKVMMTRGIRGCFVYAHNKGLRDYLSELLKRRESASAPAAEDISPSDS